jgi:hypothetical protein
MFDAQFAQYHVWVIVCPGHIAMGVHEEFSSALTVAHVVPGGHVNIGVGAEDVADCLA